MLHHSHPSTGHSFAGSVTPQEEEELRRLAAMPNIYETIAKSIAPSIYGSTDIKKAIACLLFGGSRKRWGEVSLVEREWWQGCHSWHKALVQPSVGATNHLPHVNSAWLSKRRLTIPPLFPTLLRQAPGWTDPQRRHQLTDAG